MLRCLEGTLRIWDVEPQKCNEARSDHDGAINALTIYEE